jgi:hypothetical protein
VLAADQLRQVQLRVHARHIPIVANAVCPHHDKPISNQYAAVDARCGWLCLCIASAVIHFQRTRMPLLALTTRLIARLRYNQLYWYTRRELHSESSSGVGMHPRLPRRSPGMQSLRLSLRCSHSRECLAQLRRSPLWSRERRDTASAFCDSLARRSFECEVYRESPKIGALCGSETPETGSKHRGSRDTHPGTGTVPRIRSSRGCVGGLGWL